MPSSSPTPAQGAPIRLDELARNAPATVLSVRPPADAQDAELVLRLTEIGFVPGEQVRVIAFGYPGREPLAVRIGQSTFALRLHEAALIQVVPTGSLQ